MLILLLINKVPTRILLLLRKLCWSSYHKCLLNSIIESRRRFSNKGNSLKPSVSSTTIVFSNCGNGGITDRFKAMVSLFDFCKNNGLEFRISAKKPFDFEYFFQPSEYDWRIDEESLSQAANDNQVFQACLSSGGCCGKDEWAVQQYTLSKLVGTQRYKYIIIHSSAPYGLAKFAETFKELFKPTDSLMEKINHHLSYLGSFISVSFRFVNLLGDSNEKVIGYIEQPEQEKEELLDKCIMTLEGLISGHTDCNILITTDSYNFIQRIKTQGYSNVHFIEGGAIHHHIGFTNSIAINEIEKSYTEFMLVSKAQEAFQIQVGKMYESKFPKWAATLNNVPYMIINVE